MNKMNMRARTKKMRWKTGDPLTQRDWQMLEVVIRQAKRLGYTPTSKEVLNAGALKQRFGNWGKVAQAAGLPRVDERDQSLKRQAAMDWRHGLTRRLGL